jgi:hypothetical protein
MQPRNDQIYTNSDLEQAIFFSSYQTTLQRTDLTLQEKVMFCADALSRAQQHGSKSELAREFEISRPTVYSAIETAERVLTEHFDVDRPKQVIVRVDQTLLYRAVVALRVMAPNALRPIEELIPIIYPGVDISYGKVQQIASESEKRAGEFNKKMDMSKIEAGALDEMFSQGDPVLAGVDLASGALFALELRENRAAADWAQVLSECKERGLNLRIAVKDAAKGIEAGVHEVFPQAEQRDDCFHAVYEMGKVRRWLEQRAYGAIALEEEANQKLEKLRSTGVGGKRSKLMGKRIVASRRCRRAIELHDRFEEAMSKAQEAMQMVDSKTGQLRTAEQCRAVIEQAATVMQGLDERKCRKVGKYLRNRASGLVKYMVEPGQQLAQLALGWGQQAVSSASVLWRVVNDLKHKHFGCDYKREQYERLLFKAYQSLCDATDSASDREAIMVAVDDVFEKRYRASSAIEGFNAALRPFLYVHKGVTQGFLNLFRAYYNLRTRRWGRHQGTSAYECLNGVRVTDWLSLLGYPLTSASN